MIDMSPYMNDWEDAAAIISGLDLVISVDTSILHLSAAMGKKTFGLLPYLPDWRWELETKDSYWYPNLQLFRQFRPNDWRSVFFELEKCININI
jgi:ADP-heptose:LPS heptosyltransferase